MDYDHDCHFSKYDIYQFDFLFHSVSLFFFPNMHTYSFKKK